MTLWEQVQILVAPEAVNMLKLRDIAICNWAPTDEACQVLKPCTFDGLTCVPKDGEVEKLNAAIGIRFCSLYKGEDKCALVSDLCTYTSGACVPKEQPGEEDGTS